MTSGKITSITPDWRGDTLADAVTLTRDVDSVTVTAGSTTATAPSGTFQVTDVGRVLTGPGVDVGTTVASVVSDTEATLSAAATLSGTGDMTLDAQIALLVTDTADFDEEDGDNRWLTIADSAPLEYVAVDEDANTVTLAAPVGTAYEAGLPVVIWDASVFPNGASTMEYEATVDTDRGPVPAIIPHSLIPLAGVDLLLGATVPIEEDDQGRDVVGQPLGREAVIEGRSVWNPHARRLITAATIPHGDTVPVPLTAFTDDEIDGLDSNAAELIVTEPGWYNLNAKVAWQANSSGRRFLLITVDDVAVSRDARAADPGVSVRTFLSDSVTKRLEVGQRIGVAVMQSSGFDLDVATDSNLSALSAYRISV